MLEAIGGHWDHIAEPGQHLDEYHERSWFVAGQPMQVLLGITPSEVLVATPDIAWSITPHLTIGEEVARVAIAPKVDLEALAAAVDRAQTMRRASFAYCQYCRTLTAPENGGTVCHGCQSEFFSTVF